MKKISQDFPIYSIENFYIPTNKDDIVINVLNNKKYFLPETGYNYPIYDDDFGFFKNLYFKYYNFCLGKFNFKASPHNKSLCWTYLSDKKNNIVDFWHNHINTSTINGVYYLNIPNKTSIDFRLNEKNISYSPTENELLIFPDYLEHKPNSICGEGYRIAINMEIICLEDSETLFNRISINSWT